MRLKACQNHRAQHIAELFSFYSRAKLVNIGLRFYEMKELDVTNTARMRTRQKRSYLNEEKRNFGGQLDPKGPGRRINLAWTGWAFKVDIGIKYAPTNLFKFRKKGFFKMQQLIV